MSTSRFPVTISVVAILSLVLGAAAVLAASGPTHTKSDRVTAPKLSGTTTKGACRIGYDTHATSLTPPDDTTSDNPPAGSITMTKPCTGAVLAQFTSETVGDGSGLIHIDMQARCIGTGGFTGACTVGTSFPASPGHTFLRNSPSNEQTNAMNMIWSGLKKGRWVFEVLPGGNGTSGTLEFRTFTVQAFTGG
jgi:hypothetical protein